MKDSVDPLTQVIPVGPNGHMCCFALQLKSWYNLLSCKLEPVVTIDDGREAVDTRREKTVAIEVENKPLHYLRVEALYNQDLHPKQQTHS